MCLKTRIHSIIFVLFIVRLNSSQLLNWNDDNENQTFSSDQILTIDAFRKFNDSSTHIKYTTDEEDYTPIESLGFSIRTNELESSRGTILSGWTYDNINYFFNIENGRVKVFLSHENQSSVILDMKNDSESIDDNQWHQLLIERIDRKLKFTLDHREQSTTQLPDHYQEKNNIFIGAELIPQPNGDYNGEIDDIIVSNSDRLVKLHEDDTFDDEDLDDFSDVTHTLAFLPHANQPIIYPSPIQTFFHSFSFSFRAYSNTSTLIQFEDLSLNLDDDGYLTLGVRQRQTQRILSSEENQPVNDGNSYFVQMELNRKMLDVWIDSNYKTSIELSSAFLLVENFIFGLHHQFLGCIENVTYNRQIFTFKHLAFNRRQCPIESITKIYVNQIISFKSNDSPLIIQQTDPEEFQILSLFFITQQSNGVIYSLTDQSAEHILVLIIENKRLVLIDHRQFYLSINQSINDGQQHQILLTNKLSLELDGHLIVERNVTQRFVFSRISIGKLDPWIEDYFPQLNEKNFLGCMEDVIYNEKPLIQFEHVDQSERLIETCQLALEKEKNDIRFIPSNISFSIRNPDESIEIELPSNERFYSCQLTIQTRSTNGILLSLYSTQYNLILGLNEGKLQLTYQQSNNQTFHGIFDENRWIDDGEEYTIILSPNSSEIVSSKYQIPISVPWNFSSFDILIVGGSFHSSSSSDQLLGCFSDITYNSRSIIPTGLIKSSRYQCFYDDQTICDQSISCPRNESLKFCGENDCSLVCISTSNRSLIEYSSEIHQGENEQIFLTIFTTSNNSTLFMTTNGSIEVSIILQDAYPRLIIHKGGIIYTYDFPGRVQGNQWHALQCQKTLTTLALTFDDETRHYTNLTEDFSLFGNRKIHLCGRNFIGYVQDIILMVDNQHENLIRNSLHKPGLIVYDRSVTWNIRADLPERTPCERIQCLNGGYCIQPTSQKTLAYCHCPSQYTGYRCEQAATVDICVNYQCNHGTCQKDRGTQPYCSCYEGYGGSRCETQIDPCARVNCNYGRCEVDRSRAVCRCYQGYTGSDCLSPLDACARVSCNYGTCINEGASYRCECQQGYEGATCDRIVDPCANFVCYHGGVCRLQEHNQPVCQCAPGYRGANCYETDDACHNINCNYGQCRINQQDQTPFCECLPGYEGVQCVHEIRVIDSFDPCARYDCYGGSCTNDRGVARCVCPTGRAGSRCQDDICALYPCANHGQCVPEGASRRCVCVTPYYGDDCREVYRPNPCDNIYCGYGQCREGICECHGGYTGSQCDVAPDLCASINCHYGQCYEGRCTCYDGYVGDYCDTPTTTVPTPAPTPVPTTPRPVLQPQPADLIGPKKGQLIDYGRLLGARAGPIGWILALVSGLLLLPLALAFAARQCTRGGCLPGGGRGYVPVTVAGTGSTQTDQDAGNRATRNLDVMDTRGDALAASSSGFQTERIEQTREVVREYSGMESASAGFTTYPTMSSGYGDFARDNQQQQTSSNYSQQHIIETDYHAPPVGDFGYGRGGMAEGFRDTFESWETAGGGAYSMNTMFADGGLQTDYELSNITSVSMTPNGKYAIVGQSQGPPQIWDAVNGQLVSSMQGTSTNCSKVALACSGTMLVGLASDGIDAQPSILQIWDVNTGKPVQLTHQIKCATFTLSNNSNNLVMAGNQKYGRGISVGILDLNNSELTKEIKSDTNQSYGGTPSYITLTPDERYAIVGCPSGATTNYVVFDLMTQQELIQPPTITLDADPKCSLVLNNEQILTGTRSGQVILWDIPTCQRIHTLNDNGQSAHRDRVTDLKISPDRSFVVSTSADGTAKVWDTNSKELISRLLGHKREITCVCVSTNQLVATGSKDQNICLWRAPTGQIASTMPVAMTPLDIHMAAHNRTIVAIGEKDGERQLLMLRVVSVQR